MSLKKALKINKTSTKQKSNNSFWEVRIDAEVIEPVHIVELVKAPSLADAQEKALKQFKKRTAVLVHDRALRKWNDDSRHRTQHVHITQTTLRKRFTLSKLQREILTALKNGQYLERIGIRWYLVSLPSVAGVRERNSVPNPSIDSLFQKGLLCDLATADMSDLEIDIQTALGSLSKVAAYTIDKKTVKNLGLRLQG